MENYGIDDNQISASSETIKEREKYGKQSARLNSKYIWRAKGAAKANEYIQVDLGQTKSVTGIAIQGDNTRYVTKFKIRYSVDGKSWMDYQVRYTKMCRCVKKGWRDVETNLIVHSVSFRRSLGGLSTFTRRAFDVQSASF